MAALEELQESDSDFGGVFLASNAFIKAKGLPDGTKSELDIVLVQLRPVDLEEVPTKPGQRVKKTKAKPPTVDLLGIWEIKTNPGDLVFDANKMNKALNFFRQGPPSASLVGRVGGEENRTFTLDAQSFVSLGEPRIDLLPDSISYLTLRPMADQDMLMPPGAWIHLILGAVNHPNFSALLPHEKMAVDMGHEFVSADMWDEIIEMKPVIEWIPSGIQLLCSMSQSDRLVCMCGFEQAARTPRAVKIAAVSCPTILVTIQTQLETFQVLCCLSNTLAHFKQKVLIAATNQAISLSSWGLKSSRAGIRNAAGVMSDETRQLLDYNVKHGEVLHLCTLYSNNARYH